MLADKLKEIVIAKIENDKLDLPAMPTVATKCLDLLQDPDVHLGEIGREVERDPVTSAQVLRLANSAAIGGPAKTATISQAVQRLGMTRLKTLFIHLSAKPLFKSTDPRISDTFQAIWHHSLAVAMLSRDIAALMSFAQPDMAYQTGLLHDIGKPVVGIMLLEAEKSMGAGGGKAPKKWIGAKGWLQTIQEIHRPVGIALVRKWKMPQEVRGAVEACGEYEVDERQSVSNVVRFSNAVTKKLGLYPGDVSATDNDTLIMVGRSLVGIDDKVLTGVTDDLAKRVDEMLKA